MHLHRTFNIGRLILPSNPYLITHWKCSVQKVNEHLVLSGNVQNQGSDVRVYDLNSLRLILFVGRIHRCNEQHEKQNLFAIRASQRVDILDKEALANNVHSSKNFTAEILPLSGYNKLFRTIIVQSFHIQRRALNIQLIKEGQYLNQFA